MTPFREHRLIHRNLADFNDQTKYNSRTAEANAAQQDAQYQAQTAANQAAGSTKATVVPVAKVATNQALQQAQSVYQNAAAGNGSSLDTATGQITAVPQPGVIEQSRNARLDANNATPEQRATNQQNLKGIMNASDLQPITNAGITESPQDFETRKAAVEAQKTEQMKQQQIMLDSQRLKEQGADSMQLDTGLADTQPAKPSTGESSPNPDLQSILGMLPPEAAFLGPIIQNAYGVAGKQQANAQSQLDERTANIEAGTNAADKVLQDSLNRANSSFDMVKTTLEDSLDSQNKLLATQEQNALDKLGWEKNKAVRQAAANLQQDMDTMRAQIALGGAIGSVNANAKMDKVRSSAEAHIDDLNAEFGFAYADTVAQFTKMSLDAHQQYTNDWFKAVDTYDSRITAIENGFVTNIQKKTELMDSASADFYSQTNAALDKQADVLSKAGETVYNTLQTARDDKRAQETLGYQRLQSAVATYGTNVPQAMIDSISKLLPGVDVKSIVATPTAAALKAKSGGGSGSGSSITFSPSERTSTGQALSLDNFLADREESWHKTQAGPVSPQQRADWTKEYKAKMANEATLSPAAIIKDFNIKLAGSGNFSSVAQQEATQLNVQGLIKAGDYQGARDLVDNIGAKPPEKTIEKVTSLQRLQGDLAQMTALVDRIESKVGPLPTQGAMWAWMSDHIESDPDYVALKQLRDSNLASYARGVSGDKGATTEPDVQRTMSSIINENVSAEAMKSALEQSKRQVDSSITLYLQGMRDGGYRVNKLIDSYDATQDPQTDSPLSAEQRDWLLSQ